MGETNDVDVVVGDAVGDNNNDDDDDGGGGGS